MSRRIRPAGSVRRRWESRARPAASVAEFLNNLSPWSAAHARLFTVRSLGQVGWSGRRHFLPGWLALGGWLVCGLSIRAEPDFALWRQQHDRYVRGMAEVQRELKQWRAETEELRTAHAGEQDPTKKEGLSKQLVDIFLTRYAFEDNLKKLDAESRMPLMSHFVAHVQGRHGTEGLQYTGGTSPTGLTFRAGYGDFDLETADRHVDEIRRLLEGFAADIHETNDYLAVEALRVTIFKRREIRTLADVESDRTAIERAARDPEIYLHIRLAMPKEDGGPLDQAYADAVKALEIQGHIKKGLAGLNVSPPAKLLALEHLDDLQFLAKSAVKSLAAAGFGEQEKEAEIRRIAGEAGLPKPGWLSHWIDELRGAWYYNAQGLGLNESNAAQFQEAVRRLLQLAGEKADERAEGARKVLAEMRGNGADPKALEQLEVALRLYGIQAGINRGGGGMPAGDTAEEMLAFFRLPDGFEVRSGAGDLYIREAGRRGPPVLQGLTATWESPSAEEPATGPLWGARQETKTRHAIRVAVAQYRSDTEAKHAWQRGFDSQRLTEMQAALERESGELFQRDQQWIGTAVSVTNALLEYPAKKGGATTTERLGSVRSRLRHEGLGGDAVWVERRGVRSVLREVRSRIDAELVDASPEHVEHLERQRQPEAVPPAPGSVGEAMAQRTDQPPVVSAQYRIREKTERTLTDPDMPDRAVWQGLGRVGRCLVLVELQSTYGYADEPLGRHGNRIARDAGAGSPTHWHGIEAAFRTLMRRPARKVLAVTVRLAGPDSEFKGVAGDGISTLGLVADIVGDEEALDQMVSASWDVRSDSGDCRAGRVQGGAAPERAGNLRARLAGTFHPPDAVPTEHRQHVRLVVTMKDGASVASQELPIVVIPPPILLIHGLWSDSQAMAPLQEFLVQRGLASRKRCVAVDYGDTSLENLHRNARVLRAELLGLLEGCRNRERIRTARANLVAHSLGGLLARIVILGRKGDATLPGDGDKVLKLITLATPHQGSAMADWYADWNPALFTDRTDPSQGDFDTLRAQLRMLAKLQDPGGGELRQDILEFGPAVQALRTTRNKFLDDLNRDQKDQAPSHLQVYCAAGTVPFLSRKHAELAAILIYNGMRGLDLLPQWKKEESADASALELIGKVTQAAGWKVKLAQYTLAGLNSQRFKQMVTEACYMISDPATDGVVHINSAIPSQFRASLAGRLEAPADHFSVPADPMVLARVAEWLAGGEAVGGRWTVVSSRSPGRLHVVDAEGRHVGQTATNGFERAIPGSVHIPYRDPMGEHEWLFLPTDEEVRVGFEATGSERVTLVSANGGGGSVTAHGFPDVWVEPGEQVRYETADPAASAQRVAADGTVTPLVPVLQRLEFMDERPEAVPASALGKSASRPNRPPRATIALEPAPSKPGEAITVMATLSDPDGDRLTWRWHLNGQHLEPQDQAAEWELPGLAAGSHLLKLSVRDSRGQLTLVEQEIVVEGEVPESPGLPPTPQAAYDYSLECHERLKAVLAEDPRGVSEAAQAARRNYDEALRHYQRVLQSAP